jgi:putative transposase
VILPEHLHTIWTLPSDDSDFSGRWKRIKAYFTHRLLLPACRSSAIATANTHSGNGAFGSTRFGTRSISSDVDYVHFNPVKHRLVNRVSDWPYRRFTSMSGVGCCPD